MDEHKIVRLTATALFTLATIGLAVSLAVGHAVWIGTLALALCWLPVMLFLWTQERQRAIQESMRVHTEPYHEVPDDLAV